MEPLTFEQLRRSQQVLVKRFPIGHAGVRAYLDRFQICEKIFYTNSQCEDEEIPEAFEARALFFPLSNT